MGELNMHTQYASENNNSTLQGGSRVIAYLCIFLTLWQFTFASYASAKSLDLPSVFQSFPNNHTIIFNGDVQLQSLALENVDVDFDKTALITLEQGLTALNSEINLNSEVAKIIAKGPVQLTGTDIKASGELDIIGAAINVSPVVHYFDSGEFSGQKVLQISSFDTNGSLTLTADQNVYLGGVSVKSDGNVTIDAITGEVRIETIVDTTNYDGIDIDFIEQTVGAQSSINAEGNIEITAGADAVFYGVEVSAGDSIVVDAGGNIVIQPVSLQSSLNKHRYSSADLELIVSSFSAQDAISLIADGEILIEAADIKAGSGHIEILAGLGITIKNGTEQSNMQRSYKKGKKKGDISAYETVAMRSLLDAGEGITIHSYFGDINLQAVDIQSSAGTKVKADNGAVNLMIAVENDQYSHSYVQKGTFTIKTKNKGHNIETAVPNTIIGGFAVEALNGVNIQYEGLGRFDDNGDVVGPECYGFLIDENYADVQSHAELERNTYLDTVAAEKNVGVCQMANIYSLGSMPGLEWMTEQFEANPDVNWEEIELEIKTWNESNRSLSPAFMAVIIIAVAIATSGAGAAVAGSLGAIGGTTIGSAAIAAGTSALISQATVIAANGLVNGDSLGDIVGEIASDETLEAMVTSMVTAGVLAAVNDLAFMQELNEGIDPSVADAAKESFNFPAQATNAIVESTVSAGVDAAINGGEFKELFIQSLGQNAINQIGEAMANKIKDNWGGPNATNLDTTIRYIAHAGAGCVLGAAKASLSEGDSSQGCGYGALGGVTGEIIADTIKSNSDVSSDAERLEGYLQEKGLTDPSQLSQADIDAALDMDIAATADDLFELSKTGVDLAKLGGALTAFVAGADASQVNISAYTAENAAENNALFLIPVALALLKAVDVALTTKDLYDVYTEYETLKSSGDETGANAVLAKYFGEQTAITIASQFIPGVSTFKKFGEFLGALNIVSPKVVESVAKTQKKLADNVTLKDPVKPSPSGSVSKTKGTEGGAQITLTTAEELKQKGEWDQLRRDRAALDKDAEDYKQQYQAYNVAIGKKTEQLTETTLKNKGMDSLGGVPYGPKGVNGADHIMKTTNADGVEEIWLMDSKQITDGKFNLNTTSSGMQLGNGWIENVLEKATDKDSPAYLALEEAYDAGTLKRAVAGVDNKTGEFVLTAIKF